MTVKEQPAPESIANLGITREPGYLYYLDKDGNVKRIKKTGKRKRKKEVRIQPFRFMGTRVPKYMIDCYVSPGFREVRDLGAGSAYVAIPKSLIGKRFRVILVPEDYYEKEKESIKKKNEIIEKEVEEKELKQINPIVQEHQKSWEQSIEKEKNNIDILNELKEELVNACVKEYNYPTIKDTKENNLD